MFNHCILCKALKSRTVILIYLFRKTVEKEIFGRDRVSVEPGNNLPDDLPVQLLASGRKPAQDSEGEPALFADDRPLEEPAVFADIFDGEQRRVLLHLFNRARRFLIALLLLLGFDGRLLVVARNHFAQVLLQ